MQAKQRYKEVLLFLDTCKAESIFEAIESRGLILVASSNMVEDALSYRSSSELNILLADYFSYFAHEYLVSERKNLKNKTIQDLLNYTNKSKIRSTVSVKSSVKNWKKIPLEAYFGVHSPSTRKWKI